MNIGEFAVIFMKLKNGKKLYLQCGSGKSMKWTTDRDEACWFSYGFEAEDFAKSYFKNFKDYEIEIFTEYI